MNENACECLKMKSTLPSSVLYGAKGLKTHNIKKIGRKKKPKRDRISVVVCFCHAIVRVSV